MSIDLDLTEAAWIAYRDERERLGYPRRTIRKREFVAGFQIAAAQVRAQIAGEIEAAVARNIGGHPYSDRDRGKLDAARIARGDAK